MLKQLEQENQKLRNIIEATHVGTWEWNIQTGEAVFNDRWAEIIGYTLEELKPVSVDTWVKFTHPDDLKRSEEALHRHFAGEMDHFESESRMRHKNGFWVWVHDRGKVVEWQPDGKPFRFIGTIIDITDLRNERVRNEEILQSREDLLNLMFDQTLIGIFFMMLDEPVTWNDTVDKEQVLDYVFQHQRITQINQVEQRMDGTGMAVLGDYICLYDEQGRITGHFGVQIDITERKLAEEALAFNEKRFDLALESASIGLWDWDLVSNKVYYSPLWKRMLGYGPEELGDTFETWKDRLHPDDVEKNQQAMEEYLRGKTRQYEIACRLRHKDGTWRFILTRGGALKDAEGKVYRWIGTNADITALIEEREQHSTLQRFFDISPDLMLIMTMDGVIRKINHSWRDLLGYTEEEITSAHIAEMVHPEDRKAYTDKLREMQETGQFPVYSNRIRSKNGTYRWIEWSTQIADGQIYTSGRDISERLEGEERYRLLYENSMDAILETSPDGTILSANPAAKTMFERSESELRQLGRGGVVDVTDPRLGEALAERSRTGTFQGELNFVHKDGSVFPAEIISTLYSDSQGRQRTSMYIRDISRRKFLEEQTRERMKELNCLNAVASMLASARETMNSLLFEQIAAELNKAFRDPDKSTVILTADGDRYLHGPDPVSVAASINSIIFKGETVFGTIEVCNQAGTEFQLPFEQNLIDQIAYMIGQAVAQIQYQESLKHHAIRDELTSLYNRHYFEAQVADLMEHADRYEEHLSLLLFDLDRFKRVNDTFGHGVGDEVLKTVARTAEKLARDSDLLFRYGGEEFVILLPQTPLVGAAIASEKLRAALEHQSLPVVGHQTVSIGVSERMQSESLRHWLRRTDEALYRAKEQGRNRVEVSDISERPTIASVRIHWKPDWESGNAEIDSQHKELIQLANELMEVFLTGADNGIIISRLDQLLDHIVRHFEAEEELLRKIGYPDVGEHGEIHQSLISKAYRLKQSFADGEVKASAFFSFVTDDVIVNHLEKHDTQFFSYLTV